MSRHGLDSPSGPSAKRQKLSFFNEAPVQLKVEGGTRTWFVHPQKLRGSSEWFAERLQGTEEIVLSGVSEETFEDFSIWLYSGKIDVKTLQVDQSNDGALASNNDLSQSHSSGNSRNGDGENIDQSFNGPPVLRATASAHMGMVKPEESDGAQLDDSEGTCASGRPNAPWYARGYDAELWNTFGVHARLLDLYLFSQSHGISELATSVIIEWQRDQVREDTFLPTEHIMSRGFQELPDEDPLLQLWLEGHAGVVEKWDEKWEESHLMSPAFYIKLIGVLGLRISNRHRISCLDDWCLLHNHESLEEEERCIISRREDPDFIGKSRRLAVIQEQRELEDDEILDLE